jgi:FlaA1/EpsC-like NDP-sugar epimerase
VGFVDDDGFKLGKLVLGRPVLGAVGDLERVYAAIPFDRILVCEEALGEGHLRLISEVADRYNLDVRRLLLKFDEVTAGLEGPGAALPNGKGLNGRSQSIG